MTRKTEEALFKSFHQNDNRLRNKWFYVVYNLLIFKRHEILQNGVFGKSFEWLLFRLAENCNILIIKSGLIFQHYGNVYSGTFENSVQHSKLFVLKIRFCLVMFVIIFVVRKPWHFWYLIFFHWHNSIGIGSIGKSIGFVGK